jgi:hypothetical protein
MVVGARVRLILPHIKNIIRAWTRKAGWILTRYICSLHLRWLELTIHQSPWCGQVAADDLDAHKFFHHYLLPQIPVLIRGTTSNWAWVEDWRKKGFMKRYGAERFNVSTPAAAERSLSEIVKATTTDKKKKKNKGKGSAKEPERVLEPGSPPLLLHSRESGRRDSRPFLTNLIAIPRFLSWHDALSKDGVPFYLPPRWMDFTAGPAWSGLPPHVGDGHHWSALAFGSRRWCLWPPGASNGQRELLGAAPAGWLNVTLPDMLGSAELAVNSPMPPLRLTQQAGDALYIPQGWMSGFVNLQRTIGVSENISPNLSTERVAAIVADPNGHTLDKTVNLIDS